MSIIDIGVAGGCRPCSMRLDLDPADPAEEYILRHIGGGTFYEPDVAQVLLHVLRPGDTFVDVGANVGFFTVLAGALVGPTGRVMCFEPGPGTNTRLRNNVAVNGFDHVTVIDQPAMSKASQVEFLVHGENSGWSSVLGDGPAPDLTADLAAGLAPGATSSVLSLCSTTLDAEAARLQLPPVRLLKIDTEGADHDVLRGAATLLENGVAFVVCELNDPALIKMGSSQQALRSYMAALGYDCFMLSYSGALPRLVPRGTTIRQNYVGNMLFTTQEHLGACWPEYLHEPATG